MLRLSHCYPFSLHMGWHGVPLACSEQDGLNHPDAGRVVDRPTPARFACAGSPWPVLLIKLSNYNADYPDPDHSVNMSEINNCHNVTVKS